MTPSPVVRDLEGQAFMPHAISQAQVYAYTLTTGPNDPTGHSFFSWHGPSDDY